MPAGRRPRPGRTTFLRPRDRDHCASVPPLDPGAGPEALKRFAQGVTMAAALGRSVPVRLVALAFDCSTDTIRRRVAEIEDQARAAGARPDFVAPDGLISGQSG